MLYSGKKQANWSFQTNSPGLGYKPPDANKWTLEVGGGGWGNKELEYYRNSKENAFLDGSGNLVIQASRSETHQELQCWYGLCKYTSARLITKGKFERLYGRFEARVKIPAGQGVWPAFWLLGDNIDKVGWPQCGEIDIMENIGREPPICSRHCSWSGLLRRKWNRVAVYLIEGHFFRRLPRLFGRLVARSNSMVRRWNAIQITQFS